MEELSMIRRARQYMEMLSAGTDPIGKNPVPKGEILLQPRLSRCFQYIAEVLEAAEKDPQFINTLTEERTRKEKLAAKEKALQLSKEKQISRKKDFLSLSKITDELRPLLGEDPKMPLETSEITEWLLLNGYLQHITRESDGAHRIIPTEKGNELGITREERTRSDGKIYHVNLYSSEAKDFIREHLDDILLSSSKRIFLKGSYHHPL